MWLYNNSFRLCVCGYLSSFDHLPTHTQKELIVIQPHTDTLYNKCKSTFQLSNLAKYSYGPSEDGFKGD